MRVLVLALILTFPILRADAGSSVAVAVTGEPTMQAQVTGQFQIWIQQHGYALTVMDQAAMNTITDCFVMEDAVCSRGVFENRSNADHLVFVRVELETGEQGRRLTLTGYWFAKTRDTIAEKRTCERCDDTTLAKTIDELMTAFVKVGGQQLGRLKLGSKPAGLIVSLDGTNIGVTPLERDLQPGPHSVALVRDGKTVAERAIVIEPDKVADLVIPVTDDALTAVDTRRADRKPSHLVPGVLIGVGAAVVVGGGILYAIGQDETGDHRTYRDTEALGIGVIAGGAAIAGLGAFLWVRGSKSDSAPIVTADSTGARVGWVGSF